MIKASRAQECRSRRGWPQLSWIPFALLIVTCISSAAAEGPAEILVKWRDGPDSAEAAAANAAMGASVRRNFRFLGWQLVELPEGLSMAEGIAHYQRLNSVLLVEPNRKVPVTMPPVDVADDERRPALSSAEPPVIPDDPMFPQQWNLRRIGATNAWATTTGSAEVVVAVIDGGVNYNHQDLRDNMWRNPGETGLDSLQRDKATNGVDDDDNGYVDDVYGIDPGGQDSDPMDQGGPPFHGTLCAGIIGASGNDGRGIAGINWRVSLMAIRTFDDDLTGAGWISSFLEAYEYLLMMKDRGVNIRIANMSYGYGVAAWRVWLDAHEALGNAGILQVTGAGNDAANLDDFALFPTSWRLPSMIVVGGSTSSDSFWSASNFGPLTVDLIAPAAGLWAASGPSTSAYGTAEGNSFSGPHVAGAAALLLAVQPDLSIDQLKAALFGSVDQTPAFRGKAATHGRLNVARALEYLSDTNPPAIVVSVTPRGLTADPGQAVRVVFNRPMDRQRVREAFEMNPPAQGFWSWADDDRSFSFQPDHPMDRNATYTIRLQHTAADKSGGTLDGDYSRVSEPDSRDDFVWKCDFPPINNEWANALALVGGDGSIEGNNRRAWSLDARYISIFLSQVPDWDGATMMWYRWMPPSEGGWVTFDLAPGTSFDSSLAVFNGDQLESLSLVAVNDNHGTRPASRVSFAALAGTNYSVVVAGKMGFDPNVTGNFRLTWYPTPPPGFTGSQFSPRSAAPGRAITLTGTNFTGATAVLFNGVPGSVTNAAGNNHDLRITAVVPPGALPGPVTVVTPHGNAATTALVEVLPPPLALELLSTGEAQLTWGATSGLFVVDHSTDLRAWQPLEYAPVVDAERSTLTVPFTLERSGFFRLRRQPE
jgi:subtilisin family serine protease